jgi:argininosuccinate synthase
MYRLTKGPADRPRDAERVVIGFEEGWPTTLDGKALGPVDLLAELNARAGEHGVGRVDLVESRLVGMKSRGVYETPGGTVLREALEDLCRLTLTHDVLRARAELGPRIADLVYQGQWFAPVKDALFAFVDQALTPATGEVTVELFQGAARAIARQSPRSLYSSALASFDMTGYEPRDAEGFIRVFGRPTAAALHAGETAPEGAHRG